MFIQYLQKLFGDERQPNQQSTLEKKTPQIISKITIIPLQYRDDVENLKSYVGEENWKPGLAIELELKELLSICPRERRRSDAYQKLIAYLKDEQQITLNIKTKKK